MAKKIKDKVYVWIVMCDLGDDYGTHISAVFDSEEKAQAFIDTKEDQPGEYYPSKREVR